MIHEGRYYIDNNLTLVVKVTKVEAGSAWFCDKSGVEKEMEEGNFRDLFGRVQSELVEAAENYTLGKTSCLSDFIGEVVSIDRPQIPFLLAEHMGSLSRKKGGVIARGRIDTLSRVYDFGQAARVGNKSFRENPHPESTDENHSWRNGWDDANCAYEGFEVGV